MIAKLETGVSGAGFPTIEKFARSLDVEFAELFHSQILRRTFLKDKRREIMTRLEELSDADLDWVNDPLIVAFRATGHGAFNPPAAKTKSKSKVPAARRKTGPSKLLTEVPSYRYRHGSQAMPSPSRSWCGQ